MRDIEQKVTASHLTRRAFLYIRQSTLRQLTENTESTQRQYALRTRAITLGWLDDRIEVIDCDLGHSGASSVDRAGFQRLVSEVGLGHAGIVMGLEVSRLARNSADWHRLLEICALTDTLILDEDGLYDPSQFNDRLVLGLKGTMSEAELHLLRARLTGGILNKARRGDLAVALPIGLVYDAQGRVVLDPDRQVQQALHTLFATFARTGTAFATAKAFRTQGLLFPRRPRSGPQAGEVLWGPLSHTRVLQVLHNPRYTGAFTYGRTRTKKRPDGTVSTTALPRDDWQVVIHEAHPGYIIWDVYLENQERLRSCAGRYAAHRHGPPREGPALLQGLALCGRCGKRMAVYYRQRVGGVTPVYSCYADREMPGEPPCQKLPGAGIDRLIEELVITAMTPCAVEMALTVQQQLHAQLEEADRLRQMQLERLQYEAEMARRRYMKVDPDNRLVADTLEAEWNTALRTVAEARETAERARQQDHLDISEREREELVVLTTDFPRVWHDPRTLLREKKRMLRLLVEDVTLTRHGTRITAQVRFRGGRCQVLELPMPRAGGWESRATANEVIRLIDQLLGEHREREVANILNARGITDRLGEPFTSAMVCKLRRNHGLRSYYERLRTQGLITAEELAKRLHIAPTTVCLWRVQGKLVGHPYTAKKYLFVPPDDKIAIQAKTVQPETA